MYKTVTQNLVFCHVLVPKLGVITWGHTILKAVETQAEYSAQPRAIGSLDLVAKRREKKSVIADLRHQGSMKALFPKVRGDALEAVFLNTSGGLTGGDAMRLSIEAGEGSHIRLSSQAAERAYRAQPGETANVDVSLKVGPEARIDWIPQETILFDEGSLLRRMSVDIARTGRLLLVEPIIFGRAAMGEKVRQISFRDHWRVRRDGHLVFADSVRIVGDADEQLMRGAIGAGARAMATLLLIAPEAEALAQTLFVSGHSGASLLESDILLLRLLAQDGFDMRKQMVPVIEALSNAPVPRVWRL